MKRQLLLGMEVSGGQRDDLRIMMAQQKGAWASFLVRLSLLVEKMTPFQNQIRLIGVSSALEHSL